MPRPSSPVHAKASTNCPYLTLESPHHQQQHWITFPAHQSDTLMGPMGAGDTKLGRAVCCGFTGPPRRLRKRRSLPGADNIISARLCEMNRLVSQSAPALRLPRSTQSRYLHGIDFKNPFTMSKRSQMLPKPPRRRGGTVSLHQTGYRSGWWSLSGSNR